MVAKEKFRFKIGDWVVHYYHGVGKVKDIVNKGLDENRKTYYKVSTNDIDYWIPFDEQDTDHIKPIRSKQDFEDALEVLSTAPQPIGQYHKSRKKRIHDRWLDGELSSRAKLLRDLHGRLKLDKLSFSEKTMLEKVRSYFINEWIITDKDLTRQDAKKRIRKALKVGVEIAWKEREISKE